MTIPAKDTAPDGKRGMLNDRKERSAPTKFGCNRSCIIFGWLHPISIRPRNTCRSWAGIRNSGGSSFPPAESPSPGSFGRNSRETRCGDFFYRVRYQLHLDRPGIWIVLYLSIILSSCDREGLPSRSSVSSDLDRCRGLAQTGLPMVDGCDRYDPA